MAHAGPILPMITFAADTHTTGDADIDGNLNVDGTLSGVQILDGLNTECDSNDGKVPTFAEGIWGCTLINGPHIGTDAIDGIHINDNTIRSADINDGTITSVDIAANAVGSSEILDNSITAADIASATLGGLSFATDEIAKFDGMNWVCAADVTGTPYSIFAGEFVPGDETISWSSDHGGSNDRYMSACGIPVCNLVAPVHLPHGSTVTGLTCKVRDNDSTKTLTVRLLEHRGQLTTFGPGCQVSTTQDSNQIQSISSACSVTTDNVQNSYVLDFIHGSSGQLCTGGGSNCKIFRCSISYTPP